MINLPTLLEIFSDEKETNKDMHDKFGVKAKMFPPEDTSRVDIQTQRITKKVMMNLDIEPEYTYEDNKDLGDNDEKYSMQEFSPRVLDLYNKIFLSMNERAQMEVYKKFGSIVNSDLKYKYNLEDFKTSWESLTDKEKEQWGKYINRAYLDAWYGSSTY